MNRLERLRRRISSPQTMMAAIWCCMLFFAVQASSDGLSYIFGPPQRFDALFRDKYSAHILLVRSHAAGSASALCLGLFMFVRATLKLKVHSYLGRLYAVGVLVGGLTSLPMSLLAEGGWGNRLAFFLQGSLWLATMALAVTCARRRDLSRHRRFMIRNYALTYSAVISRLLLTALQESGLAFEQVYPLVSWTWLLGLATAEWWIWYSRSLPDSPAVGRH